MPITVPMAGRESRVKSPISADISVALNCHLPFRFQLMAAFVESPRPAVSLHSGIYFSDGNTTSPGEPQYVLNSMRRFLTRNYSEQVAFFDGHTETFSESQSIDPDSFVKTPTTIEGRTVRSQPDGFGEDPRPNAIKELTHGRLDYSFPGISFYDETRGSEFNHQPTFTDGLNLLYGLDYATQWTTSPNAATKSGFRFRREGFGLFPLDGEIQAVGSTLLPQGPFVREDLKANPIITEAAINIGFFGGTQYIMNRVQVRFLYKDVPFFCAQRIGSYWRYLPTTQGTTVVGQIFEIPAPDFTDLPKLVAGGQQPAYEFATVLVAGINFHAFVERQGGIVVSDWV